MKKPLLKVLATFLVFCLSGTDISLNSLALSLTQAPSLSANADFNTQTLSVVSGWTGRSVINRSRTARIERLTSRALEPVRQTPIAVPLFRSWKSVIPMALLFAANIFVAACGGGGATPTTPTGPTVQTPVTLNGSVNAGGTHTLTFNVEKRGPVQITLTAMTPATAAITVTFGVFESNTCIPVVSVSNPTVGSLMFSGLSDPGLDCTIVASPESITYTLTVRFATSLLSWLQPSSPVVPSASPTLLYTRA